MKRIRNLIVAATLAVGIVAVSAESPVEATYGTNATACSASYIGLNFGDAICLDHNAGVYGPVLYLYTDAGFYASYPVIDCAFVGPSVYSANEVYNVSNYTVADGQNGFPDVYIVANGGGCLGNVHVQMNSQANYNVVNFFAADPTVEFVVTS